MTTTDTGVAIFLKLQDAVESSTTGTVTNGQATAGDTLEINGVSVQFTTNTLGNVTVQNAVTDINALTAQHKVEAISSAGANIITSDIGTFGSAYGLVGGFHSQQQLMVEQ